MSSSSASRIKHVQVKGSLMVNVSYFDTEQRQAAHNIIVEALRELRANDQSAHRDP